MKRMKILVLLTLVFGSVMELQAQVINCVTGPAGTSPQQNTIEFTPPPVPCGPFTSYEIWGSETENGTFSLVETILVEATNTSTHSLAGGDPSIWYYYIVFNYNCPGTPPITSNIATNEFTNANIEILNVDIQYNPNGIEITWEQSPYSQTVGYEIGLLQANGTVLPLGTRNSITDTSFFDIVGLPENILQYTISIIDGCGNPSSFNPNPYNQVLFDAPDQDRCGQLISLSWTAFEFPYDDSPVLTYNILGVNGTDTTVVGNQALAATDFNFFDFIDGDTLSFRIEVIDENGNVRSTSDWRQIVAAIVQPPSEFFLAYLTVNAQNTIDVYYYIDTLAEIRNFKIKNSTEPMTNPNNEIRKDDFDFTTKSNPHKFENDSISNADIDAYYYQVVANDSCNEDHFSTIGRTIWLHGNLEDFFLNKIEWNDFELENAAIANYRLYRDFGAGFQLIETFAPGEKEFSDNVEDFYQQNGAFCYRMEADYSIPIPYESDATYTTSSNTFCLEQRPSVYIPNAIAPNGVNNEFKPVIVFGNPINYSMKIFNRWGALIFETNSPDESWLGTQNGDKVVSGGYPYNISFMASDGTPIEKIGIVTVIY